MPPRSNILRQTVKFFFMHIQILMEKNVNDCLRLSENPNKLYDMISITDSAQYSMSGDKLNQ